MVLRTEHRGTSGCAGRAGNRQSISNKGGNTREESTLLGRGRSGGHADHGAPSVAQEQEPAPEVAEEQAEDPQEPLEENVAEGQQEGAFEEQVEAKQGFDLTPQQEVVLEPQAEAEGAEPEPASAQPKMESTMAKETTSPLPSSGGIGIGSPSVLLPAVALLIGGGILGYAVLRRR